MEEQEAAAVVANAKVQVPFVCCTSTTTAVPTAARAVTTATRPVTRSELVCTADVVNAKSHVFFGLFFLVCVCLSVSVSVSVCETHSLTLTKTHAQTQTQCQTTGFFCLMLLPHTKRPM